MQNVAGSVKSTNTYGLRPIGVVASRSKMSMNITGLSEFTIITQSVTGLQEKEIRII